MSRGFIGCVTNSYNTPWQHTLSDALLGAVAKFPNTNCADTSLSIPLVVPYNPSYGPPHPNDYRIPGGFSNEYFNNASEYARSQTQNAYI